jgi:hypothetical protein
MEPYHWKCYATGKDLETAIVGEKSTATVHAISWNGSSCLEPIPSLECELESMGCGGGGSSVQYCPDLDLTRSQRQRWLLAA